MITKGFGKIFETMFEGSMVGQGALMYAVMSYVIAKMKPQGDLMVVELNPVLLSVIIGKTDRQEVEQTIERLCAPDPNSRTPDEEGRRLVRIGQFSYRVVNGPKYREVRELEKRKEQNREAQKRFRSKKPQTGSTRSSIDAASRAYEKAVGDGASEQELDKIVESTLPHDKNNSDNGGRLDGVADTVRADRGRVAGESREETLPRVQGSDRPADDQVSEPGGRAGMGVGDGVIFCDRCKEAGHVAADCVGHYEGGVWVKDPE